MQIAGIEIRQFPKMDEAAKAPMTQKIRDLIFILKEATAKVKNKQWDDDYHHRLVKKIEQKTMEIRKEFNDD